ncbi:chloride channel protein [Coralliovum pocilloporae]|uniref:chloride channel protein n=1 Tax=Coralliovum pocilloporae TaxID=3066369 RepID=UPI003306AB1C
MRQQFLHLVNLLIRWIEPNFRYFRTTRQPILWFLALAIGISVGLAAVFLRYAIGVVQLPWLGTISELVVTAAREQPWWVIVAAPTLGGVIVGWFLTYVQPGHRANGVADVIEARALGGRGLPFWPGISSAFITIISLGSGASAGREGPMVHLGATLSAAIARFFSLPASGRRTLLAAGVASAVSASFNAPIAGVLFAHEVILGHYSISAFVPIVISSVMGTLVSHLIIGDVAAFIIPNYQITSYWEIPAFGLLGITCAAVAILFQFALIGTDWVARHITMPLWFRPVIGGFAVGCMGLVFPEVLGVGYETTDAALKQDLPLTLMLTLIVMKTAATAITLASRFGGGIFTPALYLGALTGGAFGLIAAGAFPDLASSHGLYAILGMAAVASAVLGAPISTTVIVFELTGGYDVTIALLLTASIATGLTLAVHGRSFFHWQLEMRGVFLQDGPHRYLMGTIKVRDFMERPDIGDPEPEPFDPGSGFPYLRPHDTLETALRMFDSSGATDIPVVDENDATRAIACARQVRALRYFNKELIATSVEEHR